MALNLDPHCAGNPRSATFPTLISRHRLASEALSKAGTDFEKRLYQRILKGMFTTDSERPLAVTQRRQILDQNEYCRGSLQTT